MFNAGYSLVSAGVLCGAPPSHSTLQAKFPPGTSIFITELYTIFGAATYISTQPVHFSHSYTISSHVVALITLFQRYRVSDPAHGCLAMLRTMAMSWRMV